MRSVFEEETGIDVDALLNDSETVKTDVKSESSKAPREVTRNNGPPKYSYGGENAKTADLGQLERAKQMQAQGADMESIRKATGWFKGRDGKWRFEIDDSGMAYDKTGDMQRAVSRQWAMEDLEAAKADLRDALTIDEMKDVRKYNAARVYGDETEMRRLYEQNAKKYGEVFTDYVEALDWASKFSVQTSDGMQLGDFLRHDKLFEAYPKLRGVELRFEKLDAGTRGSYSASENAIRLDSSLRDAPEDVLIHEIQHAIQNAEGFTPGSSPEYWARREYESGDFVSERLQQEYNKILNGLEKSERNKVIRYNELERELERLFLADENSEDGIRYAKLEKEQDALYKELYPNKWFRDLLDLDRRMTDTQGEYQRMYRNMAGEIEARDTASRRTLTTEGRKNKSPDLGDENTVFAENEKSYAIRYSVDDELPINLQLVLNGEFDAKSNEVHIGTTSNFLTKEIGAEALDLYMPAEKAYRAMVTEERAVFEGKPTGAGINYHGLGLEGLVDILNASEEPIAAFAASPGEGGKRENRIVLVTDVKAQGGLGVVIEEMDTKARFEGNKIRANKAITVYPKGNIQSAIQEAIADDRILYLDEKRSQAHLAVRKGSNYPTAARKADFANNIRRFWENVKWKKSGNTGYTAESTTEEPFEVAQLRSFSSFLLTPLREGRQFSYGWLLCSLCISTHAPA